MKNKLIKISLCATLAIILTLAAIALIFESKASRNMFINISKRIAAEAGAIVSRNAFRGKGANNIPFGPEGPFQESAHYAANFQYEDFSAPQLKALRDRYRLDELTEGAKDEFEKLVILRDWVRRSIKKGQPKNVDYNFNALDILKRAEAGEGFFCSEYSTVFVQCALSLGITARYLGLFKGHVVTEVWSDDYAKWAVMDIDNNLHYERNGFPQDALELHDAWEAKNFAGIKAVKGMDRHELADADTENLISYYHEFYVRMRNDWFTNRYPHWHHKANSIMNAIEWQDKFTRNNILVSRETRDRNELYFDLNTTSLFIVKEKSSKKRLYVILRTFTPNFSGFLVKIDDNTVFEKKDGELIWDLHEGKNRLEVSAINILGVRGAPSQIEITA